MNAMMKWTVHAPKDVYGVDMRTVRNHWIVWCGTGPDGKQDFTAQASIEAKYGIRLDCNLNHFSIRDRYANILWGRSVISPAAGYR